MKDLVQISCGSVQRLHLLVAVQGVVARHWLDKVRGGGRARVLFHWVGRRFVDYVDSIPRRLGRLRIERWRNPRSSEVRTTLDPHLLCRPTSPTRPSALQEKVHDNKDG